MPIAVADTCGELAVMRGTTKMRFCLEFRMRKEMGGSRGLKKVVIDDD